MMNGTGTRPGGRRMVSLGKVNVPKPVNLPSQRHENNGLDPNVEIVPRTSTVWGNPDAGGHPDSSAAPQPTSGPALRPERPRAANAGAWGTPHQHQNASGGLRGNEFPSLTDSEDLGKSRDHSPRHPSDVYPGPQGWSAPGPYSKVPAPHAPPYAAPASAYAPEPDRWAPGQPPYDAAAWARMRPDSRFDLPVRPPPPPPPPRTERSMQPGSPHGLPLPPQEPAHARPFRSTPSAAAGSVQTAPAFGERRDPSWPSDGSWKKQADEQAEGLERHSTASSSDVLAQARHGHSTGVVKDWAAATDEDMDYTVPPFVDESITAQAKPSQAAPREEEPSRPSAASSGPLYSRFNPPSPDTWRPSRVLAAEAARGQSQPGGLHGHPEVSQQEASAAHGPQTPRSPLKILQREHGEREGGGQGDHPMAASAAGSTTWEARQRQEAHRPRAVDAISPRQVSQPSTSQPAGSPRQARPPQQAPASPLQFGQHPVYGSGMVAPGPAGLVPMQGIQMPPIHPQMGGVPGLPGQPQYGLPAQMFRQQAYAGQPIYTFTGQQYTQFGVPVTADMPVMAFPANASLAPGVAPNGGVPSPRQHHAQQEHAGSNAVGYSEQPQRPVGAPEAGERQPGEPAAQRTAPSEHILRQQEMSAASAQSQEATEERPRGQRGTRGRGTRAPRLGTRPGKPDDQGAPPDAANGGFAREQHAAEWPAADPSSGAWAEPEHLQQQQQVSQDGGHQGQRRERGFQDRPREQGEGEHRPDSSHPLRGSGHERQGVRGEPHQRQGDGPQQQGEGPLRRQEGGGGGRGVRPERKFSADRRAEPAQPAETRAQDGKGPRKDRGVREDRRRAPEGERRVSESGPRPDKPQQRPERQERAIPQQPRGEGRGREASGERPPVERSRMIQTVRPHSRDVRQGVSHLSLEGRLPSGHQRPVEDGTGPSGRKDGEREKRRPRERGSRKGPEDSLPPGLAVPNGAASAAELKQTGVSEQANSGKDTEGQRSSSEAGKRPPRVEREMYRPRHPPTAADGSHVTTKAGDQASGEEATANGRHSKPRTSKRGGQKRRGKEGGTDESMPPGIGEEAKREAPKAPANGPPGIADALKQYAPKADRERSRSSRGPRKVPDEEGDRGSRPSGKATEDGVGAKQPQRAQEGVRPREQGPKEGTAPRDGGKEGAAPREGKRRERRERGPRGEGPKPAGGAPAGPAAPPGIVVESS